MALSRRAWLACSKYIRYGLLQKHGTKLQRPLLAKLESPPAFGRNIFYKSPGSTMDALRIWKLLEFLGMDYCTIVRMRRRMKRFSYPWLTYCIPAALILAVGDFIAQYHLKHHDADRTFKKFLTEEWVVGETLLFALLGFFPVGYLLSKWNLYFYRKLKCHGKLSFLLTKLLLDLFILSPIILSLMILVYGCVYEKNIFKESSEEVKKTVKEKYWPAVKDAMTFNIATRPLALFGIFYLAPIHLRRLFKTVYEIVFATYVTSSIRENVQGSSSSSSSSSPTKNLSINKGGRFSRSSCGDSTTDSLVEKPLGRWARYKRWACRNRED